jgi:predicted Zn-dependent protease
MKAYYNNKETVKRSSYEKGQKDAVNGFALMLCSVLADKWGFGTIRIQRILDQIYYVADSVNKGYITLNDLEEQLYDEHKIRIDFKKGG